jgi:Holliday junction resolvase RusA-like endonuclease
MLSDIIIEQTVSFSVPLIPPSVNHYTRTCYYKGKDGAAHRGKKLTPEALAFKTAVAILARGRTVAPLTNAERRKVRYEVRVDFYLGKGQRLDADNIGKLCCDALEDAGVIHSDAYVAPFIATPHKDERDDPRNPRTEFQVTRLEPQ